VGDIQITTKYAPRADKGYSVRFQILSLSGGGYLGLYSACILTQLEEQSGIPLGRRFDLICGTSIGGILALGLANEVPAADMQRAFEEYGEEIFSSRAPPRSRIGSFIDLGRKIFGAKYRSEPLAKVITGLLGTETTLEHAKHRVLIPAVNMTTGTPQIFKTPHHASLVRDLHLRSAEIALATSAAPTFFPLARIRDSLYADGGLYANSPDLLGLHEATHFLGQPSDADIHILSVGTTTSKLSLGHATGRDFGAINWMTDNRLFSTIISAQQQLTDYMVRHRLGDRYFRIDTDQSREQQVQLGLDVANAAARSTIKGLADASAQRAQGNPLLAPILAHIPDPPYR
jgi:patatin-like phospholipase/acyl hydrolase